MNRLPNSIKILFCIVLFGYQSWLDLLREDGLPALSEVISPLLGSFSLYLLYFLYILHRSFIHASILWIVSGKSKILKYYMIIDSSLLILLLLFVAITDDFTSEEGFQRNIRIIFMRLLNTPVLLIFCLPAYFLYRYGLVKKVEN